MSQILSFPPLHSLDRVGWRREDPLMAHNSRIPPLPGPGSDTGGLPRPLSASTLAWCFRSFSQAQVSSGWIRAVVWFESWICCSHAGNLAHWSGLGTPCPGHWSPLSRTFLLLTLDLLSHSPRYHRSGQGRPRLSLSQIHISMKLPFIKTYLSFVSFSSITSLWFLDSSLMWQDPHNYIWSSPGRREEQKVVER